MTPHVDEYLRRLRDALRDVPYGAANDLYEGIAEELQSLELSMAKQRIAELGSPESIATEVRRETLEGSIANATRAGVTTAGSEPGTRSTPYIIWTSIAVAIGGVIVPVLGWIIGIVLMWVSPVWGRVQKWLTTFTPVMMGLVTWVLVALFTEGSSESQASGSFVPPTAEGFLTNPGANPLLPAESGLLLYGPTCIVMIVIATCASGLLLLVSGLRRRR